MKKNGREDNEVSGKKEGTWKHGEASNKDGSVAHYEVVQYSFFYFVRIRVPLVPAEQVKVPRYVRSVYC